MTFTKNRYTLIYIVPVLLFAVWFGMFLERNHSVDKLERMIGLKPPKVLVDEGLDYEQQVPVGLIKSFGEPARFHQSSDRYFYTNPPETMELGPDFPKQVEAYRYTPAYKEALAYLTSDENKQAQRKIYQAFWKENANSIDAFEQAMETRRSALQEALGIPSLQPNPAVQAGHILSSLIVEETETYRIEKVTMQSRLKGITIPLYIGMPKQKPYKGVVLAIHGYSGVPDKVMGLEKADYTRQFGLELLKKGYVVYAPYVLNLGIQNEAVSAMGTLYTGQTHFALDLEKLMAIVDQVKANQKFAKLPVISYGISYGGTLSAMLGALDKRVDVAVSSGALSDWQKQYQDYFNNLGRADTRGNYAIFNAPLYRRFAYADLAKLTFPRGFIAEVGALDELNSASPDTEWQKIIATYKRFHLENKAKLVWFMGYHETAPEVTEPAIEAVLK